MAEQARFSTILGTLCSALSAAGMIGAFVLFITGNISTGTVNAHDLGSIKVELETLNGQVLKLQERIDLGPRVDQLAGIDAHTHALDGRMDALETRLRGLETDTARVATRVQGIEDSSRAVLGRR
jgi:hypothetical protein